MLAEHSYYLRSALRWDGMLDAQVGIDILDGCRMLFADEYIVR